MSITNTIRRKLQAALSPLSVTVTDDSHRHAGHSGARPGGETHFRVEIVAAAFAGKSRIERSRCVHEILSEELATRVHALSLRTLTPEEAGR